MRENVSFSSPFYITCVVVVLTEINHPCESWILPCWTRNREESKCSPVCSRPRYCLLHLEISRVFLWLELGKGAPVHLEGDSCDNSCKAKAARNCSKFFLIVNFLEFTIGIDELKTVGIVRKNLVNVYSV